MTDVTSNLTSGFNTNMAFDGDWMYIANLGRTTITRAQVGVRGQKLVNQR